MRNKNSVFVVLMLLLMSSCMGKMAGGSSSAQGGEVIGSRALAWSEPTPYGMVLIKRCSIKMGPDEPDWLSGFHVHSHEVLVESFCLDVT